MADDRHVELLAQGTEVWNRWRAEHPEIRPDLRGASFRNVGGEPRVELAHVDMRGSLLDDVDFHRTWLTGANFEGASMLDAVLREASLHGATFRKASLKRANFKKAQLFGADFSGAALVRARFDGAYLEDAKLGPDLREVRLEGANLRRAALRGVDMTGADLRSANLAYADLTGATLREADLRGAQLVGTIVDGADFEASAVHGISVWNLRGVPARQTSLVITLPQEPTVTVDTLDVAQFVHLLLTRQKLRAVIDTMTAKTVLLLGRFTPERKAILDALAEEIRRCGLIPLIFDFERSTARDFTETIRTLASLSAFVVADITNPKSSPLELQATVPDYQIPFVTILEAGEAPFSMFSDLWTKYPWVLDPIDFRSVDRLRAGFRTGILERAFAKRRELLQQKARSPQVVSIEQFIGSGRSPDDPTAEAP